jgi:hypothetical protein
MKTSKFYVAQNGLPVTGLTPVFIALDQVSDSTNLLGSAPAIVEIGNGHYKFDYDNVVEATGIIDAGASVTPNESRYIPVALEGSDEIGDIIFQATEAGIDMGQMQRLILAAVAGLTTDQGTRFRDQANTKDRIQSTISDGDRTTIVLDPTD